MPDGVRTGLGRPIPPEPFDVARARAAAVGTGGADAPDVKTPGSGPGVVVLPGAGRWRRPESEGYLADFSEVRRQRVQTRDLVSLPLLSRVVNGWRFGW